MVSAPDARTQDPIKTVRGAMQHFYGVMPSLPSDDRCLDRSNPGVTHVYRRRDPIVVEPALLSL